MAARKQKTRKKSTVSSKQDIRQGSVAWLRKSWIEYFETNGHTHLPSSSLIPATDPTLLFTTAGMVQFKPYFAGIEMPPSRRAVTVQKCLRTTDLEQVGKTDRHCTFFEMLGNFSFGDYFKEEAIRLAWDFSLSVLNLKPEQIFVTVYTDDDEAENIWRTQIGISAEKITRLGKEDNWWGPAGDSGPCGPCTELYLDRGEKYCTCDEPEKCAPGSECDRFMEYWNLVFNQYNQDASGNLHPLAEKGIDTGAGLERIAALINRRESVYDTDELVRIIEAISGITGEIGEKGKIEYQGDPIQAFRVLADHARSVSFAIADGVRPDNTGRGYVIRRIIRRAQLFSRELGLNRPALNLLVKTIVDIYGDFYPGLKKHAALIEETIRREEERFLNTLEQGLVKWREYLALHKSEKGSGKDKNDSENLFSGERAFRLYDTFGFPLEMTEELAEREGITVDLKTFEKLMQRQRDAAQSASRWKDFVLPPGLHLPEGSVTEFTGYEKMRDSGRIIAMISDNSPVESLGEGEGILILNRTCFYAESGGQQGDEGRITSETGMFIVKDTRKVGSVFIHTGEVLSGQFRRDETVEMEIDSVRREELARHHSATHLLNNALRGELGEHVIQTGSLVASDYLRFDFSHPERVSPEALERIEQSVNRAIDSDAPVTVQVLPIQEAKKSGAVATFGEKYGEEVRVVSMGEKGTLSLELCGGTHVATTGDIKYFHILKEGSPGAGNRRIEAIAGEHVPLFFIEEFRKVAGRIQEYNTKILQFFDEERESEGSVTEKRDALMIRDRAPDQEALEKIFQNGNREIIELSRELREWDNRLERAAREVLQLQKRRNAVKSEGLLASVDDTLAGAREINGVRFVRLMLSDQDPGTLRKFGDQLKEKSRSIVILLGNSTEKGPMLLFMANKNAVAAGANCDKMIRKASGVIGGGGGGRPDMAQAGGKNSEALEDALELAEQILKEAIRPEN